MDTLTVTWIVVGALVVIAIIGAIWVGGALVSMRRLSASVDERWSALASTLDRRRAVAAPLLATAGEPQRAQAERELDGPLPVEQVGHQRHGGEVDAP